MRRRWMLAAAVPLAIAALLAASGAAVAGAAGPASANEAYLDALRGPWTMTGSVMGQAVRYRATGERQLGGAFLRLRMIDAARPPQYQADVYLGHDAKAGDYIVHWLDGFGAGGARVVGTGHRDGDRLVVSFPYASGEFRDTFTRAAATDSWTLLLESREPDGSWSVFARYALTRPGRGGH